MWSEKQLHFKPEVIETVSRFLNSPKGKDIKMGNIKSRYSKSVHNSYLSFGCRQCDSIYGDWFVMHEMIEAQYKHIPVISNQLKVNSNSQLIEKYPHWCYPQDCKFCEL